MEGKYSEEQYHTVVSWIRDLIAKGVDKDSLLSGEYFSNTLSLDKNILLQSVYGTSADVFDYFVKKLYELALEDNVIKIENQIRLKVQIPRNESSAWQKYDYSITSGQSRQSIILKNLLFRFSKT